jgi:septin family protein
MRTAMTRTSEGTSSTGAPRDLEDMPHYDDSPEDEWGRATVPTSELNIIRRLSEYVTVMPIVAKADTLTIERLDTVKGAIRRDLIEAGITFAPFENTGASALPSTPPPDAPAPLLPYAIMIPDRYHHGDGVFRSGTAARPTHKQYMSRYQETPSVEKDTSLSSGSTFVQRQDLVRTYRWGVVNVLDPLCSDFLALRSTILGPCVQV